MTDKKPERSLEERGLDLSSRLQKIRADKLGVQRRESKLKTETSGLGQALRIGVEMISALLVGVALGWWFDDLLGTKPVMLIIFILLGGAAGIFNAYRTAMRMAEDLNESSPPDATNDKESSSEDQIDQKK